MREQDGVRRGEGTQVLDECVVIQLLVGFQTRQFAVIAIRMQLSL